MRRKLNTTLGFYSPSFIRMHVETDQSLLNLNLLDNEEAESIYLHEFSHFIQDVSTVYGLSNINMIVDYMKYANNSIIAMPAGGFEVPIMPTPNRIDNVHANLTFQKHYLGSGDDHEVAFVRAQRLDRLVTTRLGDKVVPYIEVDYNTADGRHERFEFGALCVVESMAYIIETECYPNAPDSPDLPYRSAEKIVELVYPEFGANRLNVLALCDAVLSGFNPGPLFYDALLELRARNTVINSPEEIYQFVDLFEINYNGVNRLSQLISHIGREATNQVVGYFNDARLDPVRNWLRDLVSLGTRYRVANPTFPLDIARGGRMSLNRGLANYIMMLEAPS